MRHQRQGYVLVARHIRLKISVEENITCALKPETKSQLTITVSYEGHYSLG